MSSPSLPGYDNLELIGKGGFSRVYRADQAKLKRKVAVKVLNFGLNDQADRVSFARETELMGRVSTHPNIVTVHDTAFTAQGQPCIVMELYPGGSLADLINEVGRLNTQEALEVGVAIASALEASHQSGVLHCDLKPQNILVSEFGQPALGDFGISTFAEERTRTGPESGAGFTLPYAAPEIVEGESPTIAADIYSLAATLYTSLCGRRPFAYPTNTDEKPTAAEHARRILLEPVQSLVGDGVPVEVDTLIRQAMSKNPAERPATAGLFASACHRVGQALGVGTSAPRIADHGALRMIEADAIGGGQVDLSMLVQDRIANEAAPGEAFVSERLTEDRLPEDRLADADAPVAPAAPAVAPVLEVEPSEEFSIDQTRGGAGFAPATTAVSANRRRFAAIAGALAVVGVIALLFVATRGGSDEPEELPPVAASSSAVATNPILAPTKPRSVELERTGTMGITVSWAAPAAELDGGDVTYEVRRQGGESSRPVVTTTNEVLLPAIANDEGVCVTVLAVRSNRTSSPTEAVCATPMNVDVEVIPTSCAAPCELTISTTGAAAGSTVVVFDRSLGTMQDDAGFTYDAVLAAGGGQVSIDETAKVGDYLMVVTFADDSEQSVLFRLTGDQ